MSGLTDLVPLLSRYYLIGFIVPAYVWLFALDFALTPVWKPEYFDRHGVGQFVALAAVALVVALLLIPWRHALFAAFAGGLSEERRPRFPYGRAIERWRIEITEAWGESYMTLWPFARSLTNEREQSYLDEGEMEATCSSLSPFSRYRRP